MALQRKAIVVRIFKATGVAVIIDSGIKLESDCWQSSQVWIDNECYGLFYDPVNQPTSYPYGEGSLGFQGTIPKWVTDKIALSNYSISYTDLYPNARACMEANPDGNGEVNPLIAAPDGALPPCFYNLPVYKGWWDQDIADVFPNEPL